MTHNTIIICLGPWKYSYTYKDHEIAGRAITMAVGRKSV